MIIPVFLIDVQSGHGAINPRVVDQDVDVADFRFNGGDSGADLIDVANIDFDRISAVTAVRAPGRGFCQTFAGSIRNGSLRTHLG